MNLDGPTSIYRWKGAINNQNASLARGEQLVHELEIQFGLRTDHAEGVTFISGEKEAPQLLVVYDNPSANRKEGDNGVRADVFDLAST
jgi:hypothetical protein